MKKSFFLFFLLVFAFLSCKNRDLDPSTPEDSFLVDISVEFENFLINEKIDLNSTPDGKIRYGVIKDVDSLAITFNGNGNSLRGIEYFTNLKYLKFTGRQRPTDVTNAYYYAFITGIQQRFIPSVDTLDLSRNKYLEFLDCSGSSDGGGYWSSVGHLKLGDNIFLTQIVANSTMMRSLNISGLPNLKSLDIGNCYNLDSVSLCNNRKLENLKSGQSKKFYISSLKDVNPKWVVSMSVFEICR